MTPYSSAAAEPTPVAALSDALGVCASLARNCSAPLLGHLKNGVEPRPPRTPDSSLRGSSARGASPVEDGYSSAALPPLAPTASTGPSVQRGMHADSESPSSADLDDFLQVVSRQSSGSAITRFSSVSDGLCEWPSISMAIDHQLEASPLAVEPELPAEEQEVSGAGRPPFQSRIYCRVASRGSLQADEVNNYLLESLRTQRKRAYPASGPGAKPQLVQPVSPTNPGSLLIPDSMTSPCRGNPTSSPQSRLPHVPSLGSDIAVLLPETNSSRSIFHTKRMLEAVLQEERDRASDHKGEQVPVGSKDLCCNPGGVGPLLSSIAALGPEDSCNQDRVVEELDTLIYMANSSANCRILGQICATATLLPFLTNWGSTLVASKAATVLRQLAMASEPVREQIVSAGGIAQIASLLLHGSETEEKARAAQALGSLADTEPRREELRKQGVVSLATAALVRAGDSRALSQASLVLLCKLAGCVGHFRRALQLEGSASVTMRTRLLLEMRQLTLWKACQGCQQGDLGHAPAIFDRKAEAELLEAVAQEMAVLSGSPTSVPGSFLDTACGEAEQDDGYDSDQSDKSLVQQLAANSAPRWRTYGDSQVSAMRSRASSRALDLMAEESDEANSRANSPTPSPCSRTISSALVCTC